MTVLGISVGTARTGVCVLRNGQLLDRHVHNYPVAWSDKKLRGIISHYHNVINKYRVTAIVVKVPPLQWHTEPLLLLMKRIEALAKKYGCEFDLTTKSELKHRIGARSTSELIEYTRRLYPELAPLYSKSASTQHRYFKRLFEAVLSAHIFNERLRLRASRTEATTE